MSSFETCNLEPFVSDFHPQSQSLEDSAVTQELLIQQIQAYLGRMRDKICADLESLEAGNISFLDLSDTPADYTGFAGDVVTVNGSEDGLEFTTPSGGGLPDLVVNTEVSSGRQVAGNDTFFKLISIGALPNTTTKNVAHNIGAAFALVHAYGVGNNPTAPSGIPLIFATTGAATNTVWFHTDATNVIVVAGVNRSAYTNSFVVLEYYYL